MTTIAYSENLGTISCDTLCVHQNVKFFCHSKFYFGDDFLLASAGCAGEREFVGNKIDEEMFKNKDKIDLSYILNNKIDFKALELEGSHLIFCKKMISKEGIFGHGVRIYAGGSFLRLDQKIKALGSGLEFATSFMTLKPDAPTKEAVEFASQFDVYTGGEVKTFDLINWRYI